jgi:diaminohydroxyphosphoribosylaminopyrimidine deaminase / 5-amino-6-(5-phosphoribosylamino)uracil reductase
MDDRETFDRHMMAIALSMARRGLGCTAPNPSVGAVIANETTGEVIARAVTAAGGRPHAETIAIAAAGERAKGATLYVTLEPCSHQGHTGPCADAIIAAGLSRVVVAIADPDPRVAGRGIDRLRAARIAVERGLLADDARWVTRGHIVRVTERRPFVTLKMALNSSGHVARGSAAKPVWVTGEAARARGHVLRAKHDAILVGAGTLRDDNPELTCRLPGLEARSPARVVLSRSLDVDPNCNLIATAREVPVWLVCGQGMDQGVDRARRAVFEAAGAHVITVTEVGGQLWLPAVMEALIERGVTRLLVEGGPTIWRAFARASLADEVALFMAGHCANTASAALTHHLAEAPFTLFDEMRLGPDTLYAFRKTAGRSTL